MPTRTIPVPGFIGASYLARTNTLSVERCINWFPEPDESGRAKSVGALHATPGLRLFADAGAGVGRAFFQQDGRVFFISGSTFFELFYDGTDTAVLQRGTVEDDGRPATIASNGAGGDQLFIVAGLKGYVYNLATDTLAEITDPDFPSGDALMGAYLDGFFVVLQNQAPLFRISKLLDGGDWHGLDVGQKNITSDNIRSMVVDERELWLLGSKTTEVWVNSGEASFPLSPVPGAAMAQGIEATFTARRIGGGLMWLGMSENGGRTVVQAANYRRAPRVSTYPIDWALSQLTSVVEAVAWTCTMHGHEWYVLTVNSDQPSWVFDATTGLWFEWGHWNPDRGIYEAHLGNHHVYAYNKHLVTSRKDGKIYEVTPEALTDDGRTIRRLRRSPYVDVNGHDLEVNRIEFVAQVGAGTVANPKVMFRASMDDGNTWTPERLASLGSIGEYKTRVEFHRLGTSRYGKGWAFELVVADPVVTSLVGARMDISG